MNIETIFLYGIIIFIVALLIYIVLTNYFGGSIFQNVDLIGSILRALGGR